MRKTKFLSGILLFLIFVGFSYLVHKDVFTNFDFDTTVRLQDSIARRFDTILSSLSLLGSLEFTAIILLVILAIKRNLGLSILVFFSFINLHILELYGKLFVQHPSPPFMFFRYDINFLFPSSYVQPGNSYPSGHASRATFISVVLIYFILSSRKFSPLKKKIAVSLFILFDIGMLISRVYLGEHWTTDVLGGSFLGTALGFLTIAFF